ncbi:MAG: DNA-directed RNA polymerase subunit alpha [Synergistaceae bacterium]|nr:DNA-directed RNA polymerase subunit alpha [Synergistaceae bacterium]
MLETLEILRPALKIERITPNHGKLSLEPLERGYGMTLGNALRRVLLSSIQGAAITSVRIDGVLHEFSTIPGVREDVIEILMNLKHIPIRSRSKEVRIVTLDTKKAGVITAADLPEDPELDFIDPNAKICTMEEGAHLVMDLYIEQGTGYLSAERPRPAYLPVDCLLTDAIFSPVLRVNYNIEAARVGQRTDYERLALEVWTNGIVSPEAAAGEAAKIIETYFGHIVENIEQPAEGSVREALSGEGEEETEEVVVKAPAVGDEEFLSRPVRELELSIRSENCLLRGGIQSIGDLLQRSRDDLLKIRNLGKISLNEIEEKVQKAGLTLREKKAGKEAGKEENKAEKAPESQEAQGQQAQEREGQETSESQESHEEE